MGHEARLNPTTSTITPRDARGRPLHEGDEIILAVPGPLYFRIAQITPNLHPDAPPGMMTVHVGCMVAFAAQRNVVNPEFVRVRTAEEAGPSNFQLLDAQPNPRTVTGPDPRD